jgi:hypothetical protein
VKVTLNITPSHLRLHIVDQGAPFNLTSAWTNDARTEKASGESNPSTIPSEADADGVPELPNQDSQWGLVILSRLRRDFGWMIHYDHLPDGGNKLVMERALA